MYIQDGSDAVAVGLGVAAAAGLGFLAFTEVRLQNILSWTLCWAFIRQLIIGPPFSGRNDSPTVRLSCTYPTGQHETSICRGLSASFAMKSFLVSPVRGVVDLRNVVLAIWNYSCLNCPLPSWIVCFFYLLNYCFSCSAKHSLSENYTTYIENILPFMHTNSRTPLGKLLWRHCFQQHITYIYPTTLVRSWIWNCVFRSLKR